MIAITLRCIHYLYLPINMEEVDDGVMDVWSSRKYMCMFTINFIQYVHHLLIKVETDVLIKVETDVGS